MLVLSIQVAVLTNEFIGGSGLVYLAPRFEKIKILVPSYLFAVLGPSLTILALSQFQFFDFQYVYMIMGISILQSINHCNYHYLVGREQIFSYNIISLLQVMLLIINLLLGYTFISGASISTFLYSLLLAHFIVLLISMIRVSFLKSNTSHPNSSSAIKQLLKYGGLIQITNLIQLANYRFVYILIEKYLGKYGLGLFSVATQISESLWIPGRSMGLVQYAHISNDQRKNDAIRLTINLCKLSVLMSLVGVLMVYLIPEAFFVWVFGSEFKTVKNLFLYLIPGVVFFSLSFSLSQFFAGFGKHQFNTVVSGVGLAFTVGGGLFLIPTYGIEGAGITVSVSYTFQALLQLTMFIRINQISLIAFYPTASDIIDLLKILKIKM